MPMPTATPSVVTAATPATTRRFRLYCGFLCLAIVGCLFRVLLGRSHRERRWRVVGDQPVEPARPAEFGNYRAYTSCAAEAGTARVRRHRLASWHIAFRC